MVKRDYIKIKVSDLKWYEKNNKKHWTNVDEIVKSIQANTYIAPIIIDENNVILAGHGRKLALDKLQVSEAEVLQVSWLSEEQKRDFRIRDNKLTELSEWDFENIKFELDALDNKEINDLFDWVFDDLITTDEEKKEIEEDEAPEVDAKAKIVEGGDLFVLWNHRLMCWDSTSVTDVEELMNWEKADLVFTDPPYNVAMHRSWTIMNDNISDDEFEHLLDESVKNAIRFCSSENMFFWIWFRAYSILEQIINQNWLKTTNCIVRGKNSIWLWKKGFRYQHELCIFTGETNNNTASDLWNFERSKEWIHPTMKPIQLVSFALKNVEWKTVLDLFGWSWSTLIACEQLNRKCFMFELDPRYCEVIIKRFHKINPDAEIKCLNRDIDLTILFDE